MTELESGDLAPARSRWRLLGWVLVALLGALAVAVPGLFRLAYGDRGAVLASSLKADFGIWEQGAEFDRWVEQRDLATRTQAKEPTDSLGPLFRAVQTPTGVSIFGLRLRTNKTRDPWGERLLFATGVGAPDRVVSNGPNRRFEEGKGDDIVVARAGTILGWARVSRFGARYLGGVAAILAWLLAGPFVRTLRHRSLGVEVLRALALASLPALLVTYVVHAVTLSDLDAGLPWQTWSLWITPPAAILGLSFFWRISRPHAPLPESLPPTDH